MVTNEQETGNEEELDLSSGMVPHHPLGRVTGIDHHSNLPIVDRTQPVAQAAASPEPAKQDTKPDKPAATPEPKADGEKVNSTASAEPKTDATPTLAKGAPVTVNGKSGKVVFVHQGMGIARIRPDDGSRPITARVSAIKVLPHVVVQSHVRRIPQ